MRPGPRFAVWLLLVALLGAAGALWLPGALRIETDIAAMLPQTAPDPVLRQALDRFADAAGRRTLFLVEAPDFARARRAADVLAQRLRASGAFAQVDYERRLDAASLDALLLPARHGLLSAGDRAQLAQGDAATLAESALRALYTPAGLMRARPFAEDPLNLYGNYLAGLAAAPGRLELRDQVATVEDATGVGVLVAATLRDSPFALGGQAAALAAIEQARTEAIAAADAVQVRVSGVLRHAAANTARAQREIGLFGSLSLAGVVLVFLFSFRSLRPLLLVLGTLGVSMLAAVLAVQALFGQIHLLSLVFGSSLIGIGVDYAVHFFCDRYRATDDHTALDHVGAAILVGMGTTALGYLAFLLPPFPGLRQMAVFSVAGIVAAGLTVLLAYPLLAGAAPRRMPPVLDRLSTALQRLRAPPPRALVAGLLLGGLLVGGGLLQLRFDDDVRTLHASPPALLDEEAALRARLGGGPDTRFFLVEGADAQQVLEREEALRERLDRLRETAALDGYSALSLAVPSARRQAEHRQWLAEQVYGETGVLPPLLSRLGFAPQTLAQLRAEFAATRDRVLTPQAWLATPAGTIHATLWLGEVGTGMASAVALTGVADVAALGAAADGLPGVRLVDRVADISRVLGQFRRMALWGLAGALLAIAAVLALRYGAAAARQLLAPVGGCLLTLAILGWAGVSANLFTVLGLLLVLGLGVDYGVFLREGRAARPVALLAISIAAATTLLAFGMLSASATPFIRSLGLAVLLGVAGTWILAIVASAPRRGAVKGAFIAAGGAVNGESGE